MEVWKAGLVCPYVAKAMNVLREVQGPHLQNVLMIDERHIEQRGRTMTKLYWIGFPEGMFQVPDCVQTAPLQLLCAISVLIDQALRLMTTQGSRDTSHHNKPPLI